MLPATRSTMISSKVAHSSICSSCKKFIAGRIFPVCIIFIIGVSVSSCDFFRKLAGRPTSARLATLEWRRDSLEKAQRVTDSVARAAEVAVSATEATQRNDALEISALRDMELGRVVHSLSRYEGMADKSSPALFNVIGGTFKNKENALRFTERLKKAGFSQVQLLTLKNGLNLVSLFSSESAVSIQQFFHKHKDTLPKDAWVVVNDIR